MKDYIVYKIPIWWKLGSQVFFFLSFYTDLICFVDEMTALLYISEIWKSSQDNVWPLVVREENVYFNWQNPMGVIYIPSSSVMLPPLDECVFLGRMNEGCWDQGRPSCEKYLSCQSKQAPTVY